MHAPAVPTTCPVNVQMWPLSDLPGRPRRRDSSRSSNAFGPSYERPTSPPRATTQPPVVRGREPRESVGGLSELHHERVAGLLEQVVIEVDRFAAIDDVIDTVEPSSDVEEFLGCGAAHRASGHSRTR